MLQTRVSIDLEKGRSSPQVGLGEVKLVGSEEDSLDGSCQSQASKEKNAKGPTETVQAALISASPVVKVQMDPSELHWMTGYSGERPGTVMFWSKLRVSAHKAS